MRPPLAAWAPAAVLAAGALLTVGVRTQRSMPLRAPLASVLPRAIEEYRGTDAALPDDERRAAGVDSYLLRAYVGPDSAVRQSAYLYVAYFESQTQGRTIHSPKNCLPGSGWEALAASTAIIGGRSAPVTVNRYLIQKGNERALVLYWYQGRGRVEANEYVVKWNLLRDAALRRHSEEALVRVMVPVTDGEEHASALASRVANAVLPALRGALPS